MRVLVSDPLASQGIELMKEKGIVVDIKTGLSEGELIKIIGGYDALLVRSQTKVTRRIIEASKLRIIGRAGVGVDNIDLKAATEKGIVVVNAPEGNTIAAAEHTMAMMLALARNIPQADRLLRQGKWERKKLKGVELRNKVLGILGLGKIGSEVVKRASAMGMRALAYDPFVSSKKAEQMGVELCSFEKVLKEADFLTIHLPLTEETRHLIGKEQLELMKEQARIINVARGGIIEEKALYEALKAGKIAGAAIDVWENEPLKESPLLELDCIVATPHLGASTEEAQVSVAVDVAKEVIRLMEGEAVKNPVNLPVIKPEERKFIEPFLGLAEKLGLFISQLVEGGVNKVEIRYNGDFTKADVTPLTVNFLKGFLINISHDSVNFVNAPLLAKNRGIEVYESKSGEMKDYTNLIEARVKSETGEVSVSGTLLQTGELRIVNLNGYSIDAAPEGHILIIPHIDKPRIIGPVGNVIGEEDVNIAAMQVGRKTIGGRAVMFLNIDSSLSQATMRKIKDIDGVFDVKYVYVE